MTRARDVANLIGSGNYSSTTFTATAGQTAFSISHTQGFVQVFMNGLLLDETVDYTSNGSAITLTSGAAAGDEIEVVKYNTFSVGDALPKSGGTMSGALTVDAAAATVLTVDRATSFGNIIDVQKDGASVGAVGSPYGGELYIQGTGANSSGLLFTSGNSIQPRKNSAADDGNIDIGASGNKFKNLYLGGGIYLGGTGSANYLEDYEEGTWTPALQNGGTLNILNASYTKVGNLVYAGFYVGFSSIPNDSAQVILTGLPFAVSASSNHYHGVSGMPSYVGSANWNNYDFGGATPWTNNTKLYWHYLGGSSSVVTNNNFHFLNGYALIMGIMYRTDA